MAVTVETLVATLEARIDKYEKNLQKAYGQTDRQFSRIERRGKQMESRLAKIGAGGFLKNFGAGLVGGVASAFSIKAAQQLIDSATRIQNALKVAGLSGEELAKVYDRLFESAQRNAAPFEALATLYGRAAQQQKELGVSTDQLLQFTDDVALALRVAGTDAGTASGALLQLGQALGSGRVQAEEFNSILEGVPTIAQAAAIGIKEAGGSVAALKQLVIAGKVSSRALFDGFAAGADTLAQKAANATLTTSQGFTVLTNSLIKAAGRFDTSTEASKRFGAALGDLAAYVNQLNFDGMMGPLDAVAAKLNFVNGLTQSWGEALGRATGAENIGKWLASTKFGEAIGMTSPALLRDRMSGDVPQANAIVQAWAQKNYGGANVTTQKTDRLPNAPKVKPISLADYPVVGGKEKKGRKGSTRATADDRFSEDLQAIRDRTAALKVEQETLNATFLEQQRRSVALDLEREALKQVRDEARRKGDQDWQNASLTKDQVRQINEVADAYARQADELRKAQEANDLQRDVLKGALSDFRSAWKDGKIDAQEWEDIVLNALDKVIDKLENEMIDAIFQVNNAGSGGGGFLGGIFKLFGFGGGSSFNPTPNGFAQMLGLAGGGTVRGPGGPTGDKIPAWLSDGEHVTRSAMAKKHAPLLAAINADKVPHFAEGGFAIRQLVSAQMPTLASPAPTAQPITIAPQISVDARNAQPGVGEEVRRAVKDATGNMTQLVRNALREMKVKGMKP